MLASLRERDAGQEVGRHLTAPNHHPHLLTLSPPICLKMGVVSGFMANMRPTESDHEETK